MSSTNSGDADAIVAWLREQPRPDGYQLGEIATHFGVAPERMRDRLRRLVDQGTLVQSEPVTGRADRNPSYALPAGESTHQSHQKTS